MAKDGTRDCIEAIVERAKTMSDWREAIGPLRDVMRQYDTSTRRHAKSERGNGTNDWTPSRSHSIEEVPIALGFLVVTGGDFEGTIMGGANYGRDNDSIAGMGGAICGALHGIDALRPQWVQTINSANRIDLMPTADELAALTRKLQARQLADAQARQAAFGRAERVSATRGKPHPPAPCPDASGKGSKRDREGKDDDRAGQRL